ncbi:tRNA pseudouridine(55) synthase TruB [Aureimonas jatrophae]|uniref:tRNA pseudouridine synthase B n=1 Tax=Aureimonas jatrophae TaxID=1166073 RepID=A0A1H0IK37_9HYPH|nr:tRNA pseudouridine(55) synthase TruB [Aureimonas jatrophae]MBB3952219.1 tRNA pseudouridine55 synthase [Aureimonas jatrophae]SDO31762.1 tRNA pseudouridine synthase B [Aureimonas jatrophae]
MARRGKTPKGRPVSGWVILDKPVGMGSTDAVAKMKWLFFAQKAGHAGTLDPLASGMLPIALGDATKTVPFVMDGTKTYRFTVRWGAETTTDDTEGPVTNASDLRPTREALEALLTRYRGEISQVPPQFSAIKIEGERAYDLARAGETVEIAARPVTIHRLDIVAEPDAATTVFEAECGKGTYVRSIARDLGRDLGCFGHVVDLRRVQVGGFTEDDLVTLDELMDAADEGLEELSEEQQASGARARVVRFEALDRLLLGTEAALSDLYEVPLSEDQAGRVLSGNPVLLRGRDAPAFCEEAYATGHGRLVAIGSIEQGSFHPKRVFGGRG